MNSFQVHNTTPVIPLPQGREARPIHNTPINDTGVMALVLLLFFVLAISFKTGYKYVADFSHHLFSVRKRQNAFENHTMSETMLMIALLANTCLMAGLSLYLGISHWYPHLDVSSHVFSTVACLSALFLVFYLLQVLAFHLIGYVFAQEPDYTRLWINGFNASQAILGLLLLPLVFISLLHPAATQITLICSIIAYFSTRIVFISKGFRIFFNNLGSYVYFILYLCTLEIVPVFLVCAGAFNLCEI